MTRTQYMLADVRRALVWAGLFSALAAIAVAVLALTARALLDGALATARPDQLAACGALALIAALTATAMQSLARRILLRAAVWLDHGLGQELADRHLGTQQSADQQAREQHHLAALATALSSGAMQALIAAPALIFALGMQAVLNLELAVVGAVAAAALVVLAGIGFAGARRSSRTRADIDGGAQQAWAMLRRLGTDARTLGLAGALGDAWGDCNRVKIAADYAAGTRATRLAGLADGIAVASGIVTIALGAWLVAGAALTVGDVAAAALLQTVVLAGLLGLQASSGAIAGAAAAWRALGRTVAEAAGADAHAHGANADAAGPIALSGVEVAGASGQRPRLAAITFELPAGTALGIVGPAGAGKSSLAAVLAGALRPTTGTAQLAGAPIGYLPEHDVLLAGTVAQNIARFETVEADYVARAVERAGVGACLAHLPLGLETPVGPDGAGLALSARRAIGLARAMAPAPRVLVLDRPEAGFDMPTREAVVRALDRARCNGVSVILASDDPGMLALADMLIVLDDGGIAACGPRHQVEAARTRRPPYRPDAGAEQQNALGRAAA